MVSLEVSVPAGWSACISVLNRELAFSSATGSAVTCAGGGEAVWGNWLLLPVPVQDSSVRSGVGTWFDTTEHAKEKVPVLA